ncbi:MAG: flagellar motor protein MotA [Alphaproteobacteria bacterium]|nr:flagellar motor protein MotA [Alphaproteobacteria bacterium]
MLLPKRYILRMSFFLAIVFSACALLFPILKSTFLNNIALNSLIVFVLFSGIILNFRSVLVLRKEIKWINVVPLNLEDNAIKSLRLLSPLALILKNNKAKGNAVISPTIARTVLDSVDMRLEEVKDISRYLIGLSTFLGLLGTFWGLMGTVGSVGQVISSLNVAGDSATDAFNTIKDSLALPLSGMGTAFSSSLLGLGGALIMGFLDLQATGAQNHFYNGLDEHLASLTRYSSSIGSSDDSVTSNGSYTNALLEQLVENMADIRNQMKRDTDKRQETLANDAEHLRFLSRIDRCLSQIDKANETHSDAVLKELRDSFRLLIRTISSNNENK